MPAAGGELMELPIWVRGGSCQPERCGSACCTFLWLEVNPFYRTDPDVSTWVRLHGVELVERDGRTLARVPTPCTALDADGRCGIYGRPERPALCAAYPARPESLDGLEGVCTYTFARNGSCTDGVSNPLEGDAACLTP